MKARLAAGSGAVSISPATGFSARLTPAPSRKPTTTPRTSRGPSGAATFEDGLLSLAVIDAAQGADAVEAAVWAAVEARLAP